MATHQFSSSQPARLCLPLAKFSFANAFSKSGGPIPWTHLPSRNDLFVIVDASDTVNADGTVERAYRFKVLQDPNLHEDIDLTLLAKEARRAIQDAQNSSTIGQQPVVTIIVRVPCIAIRYPAQDEQVRRFQVRFAREEDFYETLKVFAMSKVPFVEAGSGVNQPQAIPSNAQSAVTTSVFTPIRPESEINSNVLLQTANSAYNYNGRTTSVSIHPQHTPGSSTPVRTLNPTYSNAQTTLMNHNHTGHTPSISSQPTFYRNFPASQPALHQVNVPINSEWYPQSAITTYVPRPSTAPIVGTAASTFELPPRRDLPFQHKAKASETAISTTDTNISMTAVASVDKAAPTPIAIDPQPSTQAEPTKTAKARKRPAAKPKKSVTEKKTKTVASRKKAEASKSQDTHVVGTENSVQQNGLIDHSRAILPKPNSQISPDSAGVIQATQQVDKRAQATEDTNITTVLPRCTADTLPSLTPTPPQQNFQMTQHTSTNAAPNEPNNPTVDAPANPVNTTLTLTPNQTSAAHTPLPQIEPLPTASAASDLTTLLSTPALSLSEAEYHALSTEAQHTQLEQWMIQNLNSEEFLSLCKTLDGVWQRVFVKFLVDY